MQVLRTECSSISGRSGQFNAFFRKWKTSEPSRAFWGYETRVLLMAFLAPRIWLPAQILWPIKQRCFPGMQREQKGVPYIWSKLNTSNEGCDIFPTTKCFCSNTFNMFLFDFNHFRVQIARFWCSTITSRHLAPFHLAHRHHFQYLWVSDMEWFYWNHKQDLYLLFHMYLRRSIRTCWNRRAFSLHIVALLVVAP